MRTLQDRRGVAVAGLGLGLAIALAANLTYAVPRGPVVVGLGLVAPLVLPVVLYLRTTFTVVGFWPRFWRDLATMCVAGPAAAVSYVHTYELVLAQGEPWILAVLAPLSSDGLAGMATLALHRMRLPAKEAAPKTRVRQDAPAAPVAPAPKAEPVVVNEQLPPVEWTRLNWPVSAKEIELGTGVTKGYSFKLRDKVKSEMAS